MIALDTSFLVQYFTQSSVRQSRRANRFIRGHIRHYGRRSRFAIGLVVLCELARVLRDAHGIPKDEIVEVLDRILATPQFVVPHRPALHRALNAYRTGTGDFADYVSAMATETVQKTVTFDRALRADSRFRIL